MEKTTATWSAPRRLD